ncbi:exonuclease domain-containing protein [Embleya sp. AB8]|uniref:exonuclease domain-containing protein n=1 Tax=Embleya sp. AB8 TaxID=3156304 RepID=UPI003C762092
MSWDVMCGVDLETTGLDPERDRVVTAAVVHYGAGGRSFDECTWVADPGVEIPAEATAVHGYTTDAVRESGLPAGQVVAEVVAELVDAARQGLPIVVMNAAFDLTLLDREAERYGLESLTDLATRICVLDPRVLDRFVDQYRPGPRRLADLCSQYQVTHDGAHDACADAVAACAVTEAIGRENSWLPEAPLYEVHEAQVRWAATQQESLRNYFHRMPSKAHLAPGVRTDWPVIPRRVAAPRRWGWR